MTQGSQVLGQVLVQIQAAVKNSRQALVIFDLDSTLFDVSPRTQKILSDFSEEASNQSLYPTSVELLKSLKIDSRDWGIKSAIVRAGLHQQPSEFLEAVRLYWIQRFFSGDYLKNDRPLPGAVAFAHTVASLGVRLVYLTGRDHASMEEASRMVLAMHGFPMGELVMKPAKGSDDALFKVDWFSAQKLSDYSPIYFFENEPVNLHEVKREHPEVHVIFVDSTHSGKGEVSKEWPVIQNFLLHEKGDV